MSCSTASQSSAIFLPESVAFWALCFCPLLSCHSCFCCLFCPSWEVPCGSRSLNYRDQGCNDLGAVSNPWSGEMRVVWQGWWCGKERCQLVASRRQCCSFSHPHLVASDETQLWTLRIAMLCSIHREMIRSTWTERLNEQSTLCPMPEQVQTICCILHQVCYIWAVYTGTQGSTKTW